VPEDLEFFKVTALFERGRVDGKPPLQGNELIRTLTALYTGFFNTRNLAGVAAMCHEGFALEDPTVKRVEGKAQVLAYIKGIFDANQDLEFNARIVVVEEPRCVIEFNLKIAGQNLKGTDVIEWQGRRMVELRAYLRDTK
jgi:ketosteroid isomerase-like protein